MKDTVVEVGPATVRGPRAADADMWCRRRWQCIDDEIALFDEQPVAVRRCGAQVSVAVLPERADTAVLVCPTWWPPPRVERVQEAAATRRRMSL